MPVPAGGVADVRASDPYASGWSCADVRAADGSCSITSRAWCRSDRTGRSSAAGAVSADFSSCASAFRDSSATVGSAAPCATVAFSGLDAAAPSSRSGSGMASSESSDVAFTVVASCWGAATGAPDARTFVRGVGAAETGGDAVCVAAMGDCSVRASRSAATGCPAMLIAVGLLEPAISAGEGGCKLADRPAAACRDAVAASG